MKKHIIIGVILSAALLLTVMFGCKNSKEPAQLDADDPFNFMSYEGKSGISDIQAVMLDGSVADKCRTYKFNYKSDDYTVVGFISIPSTCIERKTPEKCLVFNRGGNCYTGLLGDSDTAAICAQIGRVVLATQYRGSDGCTGYDEFGGDDLTDVTTLIDMCEDFAFADMDDLCVGGVSRGGMMSYMTARRDKRVKKVVAVSAVTDLVSSYEERDDMKELLSSFIGGSPEEIPQEYEKRSAVRWADEISVPVLIIHSKNDQMVSYSQAEAMAKKLEENNKNFRLVPYDDSVHGLHSQDGEIIRKWLNGEDI